MGDTCETVKIEDDNSPDGYIVINKEDYDPKKHTIMEDEADDLGDLKKAELIELAESKGLEVKATMTKAEIQEIINNSTNG